MGYGGKLREQQRARELRAEAWTLQDIATELGVSKSSVSLWVRDVEFTPNPRRGTRPPRPSSLHVRKLAEIERLDAEGVTTIGRLTDREFLILGTALYIGEGFKTDQQVGMANTDPNVLRTFVRWLRHLLRRRGVPPACGLYLHDDLDLVAAQQYWSELLGIPRAQFRKPYRAIADPSRRRAKHPYGCPAVTYCDSFLHRRVMGLARALSSTAALPG